MREGRAGSKRAAGHPAITRATHPPQRLSPGLELQGVHNPPELSGDTAASRTAYQHFFTIGKDADPSAPQLIQAKAEYAKLK
jgi:hypothetical protein